LFEVGKKHWDSADSLDARPLKRQRAGASSDAVDGVVGNRKRQPWQEVVSQRTLKTVVSAMVGMGCLAKVAEEVISAVDVGAGQVGSADHSVLAHTETVLCRL
jgi:hypothetical protein